MRWFCESCDPKVIEAIDKIKELDVRMKTVEDRLEAIEQNVGKKSESLVQQKFDEWVLEREELEKRKTNVILHKVKEPDVSLTNEQKKQEDPRALLKVGSEIGVNLEAKDIKNIYRIGKRSGEDSPTRNRLMCVVFSDQKGKDEILRNARHLKDSTDEALKDIFITPDLTQKQREQDKQLREELRRRRENGEQDLVIRRGRIVKRNF